MKRQQLNLRLPEDWFELLDIARVLDGDADSLSVYVRDLIAAHVAGLREDEDVQAVVRRKEDRAARRGKVTSIQERRARREK